MVAPNPNNFMYPLNLPSDPTLTNINGTWYMYYGIHEKGIYYTTLENEYRMVKFVD
jgi:hypothetical protein